MNTLPFQAAHQLEQCHQQNPWLVEGLWTQQAVGIIGGEPKCCKTFMALSLAVAVASGRPCLGRFQVHSQGGVLLFAAEDALFNVRKRLEGLCQASDVNLHELDIKVITSNVLRLDLPEDQERLRQTVAKLQPKLLILDPFVRLHRIDENSSGEVAPILAYLRELQRTYHVAIGLVHHAKKGAGKSRAGQALRGSSEFHAWGDSNLYLRKSRNEQIALTIEHRSEASQTDIPLELKIEGASLSLEITDKSQNIQDLEKPATDRIEQIIAESDHPLDFKTLRQKIGVRTATAYAAINELIDQGRVRKTVHGYQSSRLNPCLSAATATHQP
jgi:RecA-family ATPase